MPKRDKNYTGLRWLEWLFPAPEEPKELPPYPTDEEWERIKANREALAKKYDY